MNGTKAKMLRKLAFEGRPQRPTKYVILKKRSRKYKEAYTAVCDGDRASYKLLKGMYKNENSISELL